MIRLMKETDLNQVILIEEACFSVPWTAAVIMESLEHRFDYYWVYEENDIIAGYLNLRVIVDEGELNRIAVAPRFQGQGIAKKLMGRMVAFSKEKGVQMITLEVRKSNQTAISLYKSYGFAQVAIRKQYYHQPIEDGIIMWRR